MTGNDADSRVTVGFFRGFLTLDFQGCYVYSYF